YPLEISHSCRSLGAIAGCFCTARFRMPAVAIPALLGNIDRRMQTKFCVKRLIVIHPAKTLLPRSRLLNSCPSNEETARAWRRRGAAEKWHEQTRWSHDSITGNARRDDAIRLFVRGSMTVPAMPILRRAINRS